MNETANDNNQSVRKCTMKEVDSLAAELCVQFSNHKYFRWYCSIIWKLGIDRIQELRGRVKDAKLPSRLFTMYANEELKQQQAQQRLRGLHAKEEDQSAG